MDRSNADRFRDLLFYAVVLLVGYLAFIVIKPFLAPLAWAAIFAMTLNPLRQQLSTQIGATRAALGMTVGTAILIVGPLALVRVDARDRNPARRRLPPDAAADRPARRRSIAAGTRFGAQTPFALPPDPTMLAHRRGERAVAFLAPRLGNVLADVAATLASLFIMLFALFFLLRDAERMTELLRTLLPFPEEQRDRADERGARSRHCQHGRRADGVGRARRHRRHRVLGARRGGAGRLGCRGCDLLVDPGGRREHRVGAGGAVVAALRQTWCAAWR